MKLVQEISPCSIASNSNKMKNAYTHAYSFHPQTGVFNGVEFAQESPLETGVYLLPASATLIKPPQPAEGKQAVWHGGSWKIEDIPLVEEPAPPAPALEQMEMQPLPPTPPVEYPEQELQPLPPTPPIEYPEQELTPVDLDNLPPLPEPPPLTWDSIRAERNFLLSQSDWTQLADAPPLSLEQKQAWTVYRQALRDVPSSFATPEEVVWPTVS